MGSMGKRDIPDYDSKMHKASIDVLQGDQFLGVRGVKEFKGEKAGPSDPVLYLGMYTHGNEPGSALSLRLFMDGTIKLMRGRVIAAINNLPAQAMAQRAVSGDPFGNMNRLPLDDLTSDAHRDNPSEVIQRMRQLSTVMSGVTHGLDLHTVPHSSAHPMKLNIKGDPGLAASIGIENYITSITDFQYDAENPDGPRTVAFGNHIGGIENNIPVAEIEGGGPETKKNNLVLYETIVKGTLSVLANLGIIDLEEYGLALRTMEQRLYKINQWFYGRGGQHRLAKQFSPFESVKKGDSIMVDKDGNPFVSARSDGHIIMPPAYTENVLPESDDGWLSEPVQVSTVQVV